MFKYIIIISVILASSSCHSVEKKTEEKQFNDTYFLYKKVDATYKELDISELSKFKSGEYLRHDLKGVIKVQINQSYITIGDVKFLIKEGEIKEKGGHKLTLCSVKGKLYLYVQFCYDHFLLSAKLDSSK